MHRISLENKFPQRPALREQFACVDGPPAHSAAASSCKEILQLYKELSIIFLLMMFVLPAEGKVLQPSTPSGYVEALQIADAFLWAWVNRDADGGRRLISRGLSSKLQKENHEEWFRNYMIGLSNPHHHSFEIGSGKQTNTKRFSFLVTLYEYYTGEPKAFKYKSKIEVIQEGDSWRVDILPLTSDNQ